MADIAPRFGRLWGLRSFAEGFGDCGDGRCSDTGLDYAMPGPQIIIPRHFFERINPTQHVLSFSPFQSPLR